MSGDNAAFPIVMNPMRPFRFLSFAAAFAVPFLVAAVADAEPEPQELLRAAKKNMQDRTWKVDVLVQGERPCRVKGLIHEADFDLTVKTETGVSRQIVIGKAAWVSTDGGKTFQKSKVADRRYYYLAHASMSYREGDRIPPFDKLKSTTTPEGVTLARVQYHDPQPVAYMGDRPNAWISFKDDKPDIVVRSLGPLMFEKNLVVGDVHYTPVPAGEKILPPPGNPKAVENIDGPEDLLSAAMKKMESGIWEVDAEVEVAKKARLHGLMDGRDFDLTMEQKDGDMAPMHTIGLKGEVWGSLDGSKTWKAGDPSDIMPYNWVHSPITYKIIPPPYLELGREPHDGETWVKLQLKVDETVDDKNDLPTYWVALDKGGQPKGVARYTGLIISMTGGNKPIRCEVTYRPATTKAAITPPPVGNIVRQKPVDDPALVTTHVMNLPGAKLKLTVPNGFKIDVPDGKEHPQALATFSRRGGAWGTVSRGTHGLAPEALGAYMNQRVNDYSKQLPPEFNVKWLRQELITVDGRQWADMRFVPTPKGAKNAPREFKEYAEAPLYTRFFGTSYGGQLLEIMFTANLDTDPETKLEIDQIMDSVRIEATK